MIKEELNNINCICGGHFEWELMFTEENRPKQIGNAVVKNTFNMHMNASCKQCGKKFVGVHYAVGKTQQNYVRQKEEWEEDMLSGGKLPDGFQQLVQHYQQHQEQSGK